MKKLSKNFQILLAASVVLFIIFSLLLNQKSLIRYSWEINPLENGQYEVYLRGSFLDKMTVADLRLIADQDSQISSIESGGFFTTPIIDSIKSQQSSYLIIKNPSNKTAVDKTKPLLIITTNDTSSFEILPVSQIYISKKGVFYPEVK